MLHDVVSSLHQARACLPGPAPSSVQLPPPGTERTATGSEYGRFSVIGATSSQLLSRVLKPVFASYASSEDLVRNGQFFSDVMTSEGINSLWKHGEGLSFDVMDCRELSFRDKGNTAVRQANPYRTWRDLNTTTCDAYSPSSSPEPAHKVYQRSQRLTRPCRPVPFSFFESAQQTKYVHYIDLNAHRQQQRKSAHQFCCDDSDESTLKIVMDKNKDANTSDKWSCVQHTGINRKSASDNNIQASLKFPVLLIRKCYPADESVADRGVPLYVQGWDIILPRKHCSSVFLALNMAGGRSIGVEEKSIVDNAAKVPSFPRDYPDTTAGSDYWKKWRSTNHLHMKRRPQQKRKQNKRVDRVPNLKSLFERSGAGCPSDLRHMTDLVVMRNKQFAEPFFPESMLSTRTTSRMFIPTSIECITCLGPHDCPTITDFPIPQLPFSTLIRVYLTSSGRGVPQCGSLLFQPSREDYERWLDHRRNRTSPTTNKNRKLGDWIGPPRGEVCERALVGVVSSSLQPSLYCTEKSGMGFCEAGRLSQMVSFSTHVLVGRKAAPVVPLIMYRNPLGDTIRPALFHLCLN